MIEARFSINARRNPEIRELARAPGEGNGAWIQRALAAGGEGPRILLLGGASLIDFRLRVAQSQVRNDMKPSFWSHVAVFLPGEPPAIWQVSLDVGIPLAEIPGSNAISEVGVEAFEDPHRFPNIGLLRFPGASAATIADAVRFLRLCRLSEDFLTPWVRWLGFILGAKGADNPLLAGTPMPAAQLVDSAFAHASVDIVPGVSSRAACPEAIWQSALWWSEYYAGDEVGADAVPSGFYTVDQQAAFVRE